MPSNQTPNYKLSQWERADKVQMEDFNADNAKIDAALAGKADTSALTSLQAAMNGKASQSALNGLSSTVASHAAALKRLGNCRIESFEYIGAGTTGDQGATEITFSARPVFFLIFTIGYFFLGTSLGSQCCAVCNVNGSTRIHQVKVSWSGNQCAISSSDAELQANLSGRDYRVVAFYSQDGK